MIAQNTNQQDSQDSKAIAHQTAYVKNEEPPAYAVQNQNDEENIIAKALEVLSARMRKAGDCFNSPATVKKYLTLKMAEYEHEVFTAIFLDAQHRVIRTEEMFRGTLTQTSVYPREVVKAALSHNACAVMFAHNHPSGMAEPSRSDELLTSALKQALALVDVRTLDHFIVAGDSCLSFAERGLI